MYENIFICIIGLALHFSMKWQESREIALNNGQHRLGLMGYVKSVPAISLISLLSAVGAFYVCDALDWMNPGMAFACGYLPNSMVKNIGDRFSGIPK